MHFLTESSAVSSKFILEACCEMPDIYSSDCEALFPLAIISDAISCSLCSHGGLPPHNWCGVWNKDYWGERAEDQAADLGHSRAGALQSCDAQLLSGRCRSTHGVWHHQVEICAVCTEMQDLFQWVRLLRTESFVSPHYSLPAFFFILFFVPQTRPKMLAFAHLLPKWFSKILLSDCSELNMP